MLESLIGLEYLVKMLSDVNLIKNCGIVDLTVAIGDFLILSSPLVCLCCLKIVVYLVIL
jgi:hypothetical protein